MAIFHRGRSHAVGGGVVAGLIGGIVLSLILVLMTRSSGGDAWTALKGASAPIYHDRAGAPGFDAGPVALGVLFHLAIATVWGVLFGLIFYGLSRGATVLAGAVWGIVVWLGMYYVVLPAFGLGGITAHVPVERAVLLHVVFGLVVGASFLPYQRRSLTDAFVRT